MITLKVVTGLFVDGFGSDREEQMKKRETLQSECVLCSLSRLELEQEGEGFVQHLNKEHDFWEWIACLLSLSRKPYLTHIEREIIDNVNLGRFDFLPNRKCFTIQNHLEMSKVARSESDKGLFERQRRTMNSELRLLERRSILGDSPEK